MAANQQSTTCSSGSSEESPEYTSVRECHVILVDLLKPAIGSLGDTLFARGLIPLELKESIQETRESVRKVLSYLTTQITYNPSVYHKFVSILREQGQWTELIVEKLTSCYESQTATPVSLKSNESQSKLRFEFTVPRDVPLEVFRVLKSVQVSILVEDQNKCRRALVDTHLNLSRDNSLVEQGTLPPEGPKVEWVDKPHIKHGAAGRRDILYIVSKVAASIPDIVPKRTRGPLTEEERRKLEEQGVYEDFYQNDLSIMTARERLDKLNTVECLLADKTTCEALKSRVTELMNTTDKEGVVLHYIGPGKKGTGDWCFSDGFIRFREIMGLYTQHFRGRVLTIVSDCSYSGSWVREAMTFMDEVGVGLCGHMAKEKGILVKVCASCLANEIPAELAFSTHCAENDKNTRVVTYKLGLRRDAIHDGQHPSVIDFTQVQCKNKIDQPCTMAPGSTWQMWSVAERIFLIRSEVGKEQPTWHYIIAEDNEDTIQAFFEAFASDNPGADVAQYGEILESGCGKEPPDHIKEKIIEQYFVNYTHC